MSRKDTARRSLFAGALALSMLVSLTCAHAAGRDTILYSFKGGSDGANPTAVLLADGAGNFYGITYQGGGAGCGPKGCGTVFKLAADGTETVLHAFRGGTADGAHPWAGLISDSEGNLYGTTIEGGTNGIGTVFEIPASGGEIVIHNFTGRGDGASPFAGLIADSAGNLYGTTMEGGSQDCPDASGCGTVFKVAPDRTETVLYAFCSKSDCTDGLWPEARLLFDKAGDLYGTTYSGGEAGCERLGCGAVFKLEPDGKEKVLYAFTYNDRDGAYPSAGLVADKSGNLYGTTVGGGIGVGTIFKVPPDGTKTIPTLYSFLGRSDGSGPYAELIANKLENFYGTTRYGGGTSCGGFGCGTVFEFSPDGQETILHSFRKKKVDGTYPYAGLIADRKGNLFGTTYSGGEYGHGTVFRVKE